MKNYTTGLALASPFFTPSAGGATGLGQVNISPQNAWKRPRWVFRTVVDSSQVVEPPIGLTLSTFPPRWSLLRAGDQLKPPGQLIGSSSDSGVGFRTLNYGPSGGSPQAPPNSPKHCFPLKRKIGCRDCLVRAGAGRIYWIPCRGKPFFFLAENPVVRSTR